MKKSIILIISCCISGSILLNAQIQQGKILLGISTNINISEIGSNSSLLSMSFGSLKAKSDAAGFEEGDPAKITNFNLLPKVGYFITDNVAVGLDLATSFNKTKDEDNYDQMTVISAGPFARLYIPSEKVIPFLEAGATFGSINSKYDYGYGERTSKTSLMSYGGGVGIAAPLGERVTFDIMAVYNSFTTKDKEDNPDNDRWIYSAFGIKFGFLVMLGSE